MSAAVDRHFGALWAVVCGAAGALALYRGAWAAPWFMVAGAMLALALFAPRLLAPLRRAWMRLGAAMHRVTQPVIVAVMFFGAITPLAIVLRWCGRDVLKRRIDPAASSYWEPYSKREGGGFRDPF